MSGETDILTHYGKKGMKWGVRNDKKSSSTRRSSADRRAVDALSDKKTSELSNKQIKKMNDRYTLEKNLGQHRKERSTLMRGQRAVNTVLGLATTATALYALRKNPLVKAGASAVANAMKKKVTMLAITAG